MIDTSGGFVDLRGTDYVTRSMSNVRIDPYAVESLIADYELEAQEIHDAFLAPRDEPAFQDPRPSRPRREEVVRERCTLVKERRDPFTGALGARLRSDRLNCKNAGKPLGPALDVGPSATTRTR